LRRVAKVCEDCGQRVQNSVFECLVDAAKWTSVRADLIREIEEATDSLRFYFLGDNWKRRVEHVGAKPSYDPRAAGNMKNANVERTGNGPEVRGGG